MAEMTTQDIVKKSVASTMPGVDWQAVYAHIRLMIRKPQHRIFRANNTLLVIDNHGDNTASVSFLLTADPIKDMAASIQDFCRAMKKCEFTEVSFTSSRPAFLRMIERAGYKPKVFPATDKTGASIKVTL